MIVLQGSCHGDQSGSPVLETCCIILVHSWPRLLRLRVWGEGRDQRHGMKDPGVLSKPRAPCFMPYPPRVRPHLPSEEMEKCEARAEDPAGACVLPSRLSRCTEALPVGDARDACCPRQAASPPHGELIASSLFFFFFTGVARLSGWARWCCGLTWWGARVPL